MVDEVGGRQPFDGPITMAISIQMYSKNPHCWKQPPHSSVLPWLSLADTKQKQRVLSYESSSLIRPYYGLQIISLTSMRLDQGCPRFFGSRATFTVTKTKWSTYI